MGQTIVISAVNLRKGGTLTILNDCLRFFSEWNSGGKHRVVAIVHSRELAPYPNIEYIEIPWSIRSWCHRLWCEYMTMHKISKQLAPVSLWLSLHDTTPRVKAERQAVYCHNSYPFFRWRWRHLLLNYRIVSFSLFTKWIYRINIHRNQYIIVQQEWFRQEFMKMFGIEKERIIVSPPASPTAIPMSGGTTKHHTEKAGGPSTFSFLYPAYPDVHKNMECLCEAAHLLEQEVGCDCFRVVLTTDKDLNKYSRWIYRKWGSVESLKFVGFQSKENLYEQYVKANCLVFPSKVETWGLPISEYTVTGKPMILADLPYAHETASGSKAVAFFDPDAPHELKEKMLQVLHGNLEDFKPQPARTMTPPVAYGWNELLDNYLLSV